MEPRSDTPGGSPGSEAQHGQAAASDRGAGRPAGTKAVTASTNKLLTSVYRGVCWNRKNYRWQASLNNQGHYIYLGSYKTQEEAAAVFDRAALRLRGVRARLNFPRSAYTDAGGHLLPDPEMDRLLSEMAKPDHHKPQKRARTAGPGSGRSDPGAAAPPRPLMLTIPPAPNGPENAASTNTSPGQMTTLQQHVWQLSLGGDGMPCFLPLSSAAAAGQAQSQPPTAPYSSPCEGQQIFQPTSAGGTTAERLSVFVGRDDPPLRAAKSWAAGVEPAPAEPEAPRLSAATGACMGSQAVSAMWAQQAAATASLTAPAMQPVTPEHNNGGSALVGMNSAPAQLLPLGGAAQTQVQPSPVPSDPSAVHVSLPRIMTSPAMQPAGQKPAGNVGLDAHARSVGGSACAAVTSSGTDLQPRLSQPWPGSSVWAAAATAAAGPGAFVSRSMPGGGLSQAARTPLAPASRSMDFELGPRGSMPTPVAHMHYLLASGVHTPANIVNRASGALSESCAVEAGGGGGSGSGAGLVDWQRSAGRMEVAVPPPRPASDARMEGGDAAQQQEIPVPPYSAAASLAEDATPLPRRASAPMSAAHMAVLSQAPPGASQQPQVPMTLLAGSDYATFGMNGYHSAGPAATRHYAMLDSTMLPPGTMILLPTGGFQLLDAGRPPSAGSPAAQLLGHARPPPSPRHHTRHNSDGIVGALPVISVPPPSPRTAQRAAGGGGSPTAPTIMLHVMPPTPPARRSLLTRMSAPSPGMMANANVLLPLPPPLCLGPSPSQLPLFSSPPGISFLPQQQQQQQQQQQPQPQQPGPRTRSESQELALMHPAAAVLMTLRGGAPQTSPSASLTPATVPPGAVSPSPCSPPQPEVSVPPETQVSALGAADSVLRGGRHGGGGGALGACGSSVTVSRGGSSLALCDVVMHSSDSCAAPLETRGSSDPNANARGVTAGGAEHLFTGDAPPRLPRLHSRGVHPSPALHQTGSGTSSHAPNPGQQPQ